MLNMRTLSPSILSILLILAQLAALTLAMPVTTSPIGARGQFCSNAPTTKAGNMLDRRARPIHHFTPRSTFHSVIWCVPGSRTFVTLQIAQALDRDRIWPLLVDAFTRVHVRIQEQGDGLLPSNNGAGLWQLTRDGIILSVANANNHQTTWGVFGAAIAALADYMNQNRVFGTVAFNIFDGSNQVGQGSIM